MKRRKSLPGAIQIAVLKCASDGIEIQGAILSQERVIRVQNLVTQCDQVIVGLLSRTQVASFEGLLQLLHLRSALANVLLPEG